MPEGGAWFEAGLAKHFREALRPRFFLEGRCRYLRELDQLLQLPRLPGFEMRKGGLHRGPVRERRDLRDVFGAGRCFRRRCFFRRGATTEGHGDREDRSARCS